MDLSALRQQILLSNKTASEKAETFLLKSQVNDLSKDEWRMFIAGIPEDVEKGIGRLKSAGFIVVCSASCTLDASAPVGITQHTRLIFCPRPQHSGAIVLWVFVMFGMSATGFFGLSHLRRLCQELQQHTFGEYDNTDLLMPSGNMPFRRTLAAHAAISVTAQQHKLRSSLSFTAKDFDIVSDYVEKGTTAAWVQTSLATAVTRHAVT
ncbi:hypothetical protein WJX77_005186 [Trebouxia sp. C0004]